MLLIFCMSSLKTLLKEASLQFFFVLFFLSFFFAYSLATIENKIEVDCMVTVLCFAFIHALN